MSERVRVFVSYAWEDEAYRGWVQGLARRMVADGVEARLDAWHLKGDIPAFMNAEVRLAAKVLVLASPKYREKVHAMEEGKAVAGVGWELGLIDARRFAGLDRRGKVVVAVTRGTWQGSVPDSLIGLPSIDLQADFEAAYRKMMQALHDQGPRPPAIGGPRDWRDPEPAPVSGPPPGASGGGASGGSSGTTRVWEGAPRSVLADLLASVFDEGGLVRFVEGGPQGTEVGQALPRRVPMSELSWEAASVLERWGLVDAALFERLRERFPGRRGDVDAVAALCLR